MSAKSLADFTNPIGIVNNPSASRKRRYISMAQIVHCPSCDRRLQLPEDILGPVVQCSFCGQAFSASTNEPAPSTAELAAPCSDITAQANFPVSFRGLDEWHTFHLQISKTTLRRAAIRYYVRLNGYTMIAVWILLPVILLFVERTWLIWLASGLAILAAVLQVCAIARTLASAKDFELDLAIAFDRVRVTWEGATAEVSWRDCEELWIFPDLWILFPVPKVIVPIPGDQLPQAAKTYLMEQMLRANVPVLENPRIGIGAILFERIL